MSQLTIPFCNRLTRRPLYPHAVIMRVIEVNQFLFFYTEARDQFDAIKRVSWVMRHKLGYKRHQISCYDAKRIDAMPENPDKVIEA